MGESRARLKRKFVGVPTPQEAVPSATLVSPGVSGVPTTSRPTARVPNKCVGVTVQTNPSLRSHRIANAMLALLFRRRA